MSTDRSPLSTGPGAARSYEAGVAHLLGGDARRAAEAFCDAVTHDPCFALGHAGLAVALAALGSEVDENDREDVVGALSRARRCSRRISRRERHHVEVVHLAVLGDLDRASALGREHLTEFPFDAVVRFIVTARPPPAP